MSQYDIDVAWLHLLKKDTWMRVDEIYLAAMEASMVNLQISTKPLTFELITATMIALCAEGKVEEKEVVGDRGNEPAWKLAGEQPTILPADAFLAHHQQSSLSGEVHPE